MKQKRFMSLLLTLCMILSMLTVFAEETTSAENATIYLTVNNKGVIAADNEGKIMANREVAVTDINSDGKLTCDEALLVAHKTYNTEDGYIGGAYVTKLWGIETYNTLFFLNNEGLVSGVGTDTVSNGDKLTASVNKDDVTYADWYTFFDSTEKTVSPNEEFTLTLKGHLGMAFDEADMTDIPLSDISIGTWDNGVFTQIDDKITDENGNVILTFSETGIYYITAQGTVKDMVFDWASGVEKEADCPIIAPVSIITVTENDGTETTPPTDEKEDVDTPATPPATEDVDYNVVGNTILENIAGTYKDTVSDWIAFPEWYVMDMGAYENYNPETENKLSSTTKQDYVNYAIKAINAATKDTDIDKAVLGLAAISKNPELLYCVNSNTPVSAIEKLNGVTKSTSVWATPYTLAVYNQGEYETEAYEAELVNALLASQSEDGSWYEYGKIDDTANAICGLSFYKDKPEVNDAIEKALNFLSTQQNDTGGFGGNSNSTAMVVIGLCAAGVDLENDARFIKNGNNIIDGLLSFVLADNSGFGYKNNTNKDSYATEQAFRALIAVMQTLKTGKAYNIYDFSNNELTSARETGSTSSSSSSIPSEPSDDNITVTVTIKADTGYWLNNYKVEIPSNAATVYDAFVKACDANSITHKGAASGYVSSMTKGNKTLAEFDKGENSGWLYKVNGETPIVGLTDYEISDGDKIVWYYTEDWTKDPSAKNYSSGGTVTKYTVTFDTNGGSEIKSDTVSKNDTLDEPSKPTKEGFVFEGWYTDKELTKEYDFNNKVTNNFTLYAKWNVAKIEETPNESVEWENPFADVSDNDWYYDDVKKAMEIGLFNGISENSFAPNKHITRSMLVTVLYRYDGEKGFSKKQDFTDCKDNEWYSEAVYWASENDIISGYGNDIFGADDFVTRQQLVTILYRYAGTKTEADLSEFTDNNEIEEWAKDAFAWAVGNKIIFGTDSKELNPNGHATRAEMAAIFIRYINTLDV